VIADRLSQTENKMQMLISGTKNRDLAVVQATGGFYLCLQGAVFGNDVVLSFSRGNDELKTLALSFRLCTPDPRQTMPMH